MRSEASTVEDYLAELPPEERRIAIEAIRNVTVHRECALHILT